MLLVDEISRLKPESLQVWIACCNIFHVTPVRLPCGFREHVMHPCDTCRSKPDHCDYQEEYAGQKYTLGKDHGSCTIVSCYLLPLWCTYKDRY